MSKPVCLPDGTVVTDCLSGPQIATPSATTSEGNERLALGQSRVPDVLECLANLSSDEVFTPPRIANEMLDLLPAEVWTDPTLRWLDPGCKSGVFLREAARRLMVGLATAIPDEDARRRHIFTEMLHGYAITELTAMTSRRSLYYTKDATSEERSVVIMPTPEGNVRFYRGNHTFKNGSCAVCGASETIERGAELENHAYDFIHGADSVNVKFDVVIGNPPYQLSDGGGTGSSAVPIYHLFVQRAFAMKPRYVSFIIPSRWFSSGKGLGKFREKMLGDRHISHLVDYPSAADAFPDVEIKGGVCYFLWDRDHDGTCAMSTVEGGSTTESSLRFLDTGDVLVRFSQGISVLAKVQAIHEGSWMNTAVSSRKPFGLDADVIDCTETKVRGSCKLYKRGGTAWMPKSSVTKNPDWIPKYKVLFSKAYNGGDGFPHQITGRPIVAAPNSVCTETYLVAGVCDSNLEAENLAAYLKTRFVRFMVSLRKITQNSTKDSYAFVPALDMKVCWTDEMLYKRYGLTQDEIDFIESRIKEMS